MGDSTIRELVYGKGAHADTLGCLDDLTAGAAAQRVPGYPHSIWQIVLHMNYWMDYELSQIAGKNPTYPDHAIDSWPEHPSRTNEEQWKAARQHFAGGLEKLAALADADDAELRRKLNDVNTVNKTPKQTTVRALLMQITAHNSYHAGQIALLRRQAGVWPPERGGDTW